MAEINENQNALASTSANELKPWSPNVIVLITIFFSLLPGGILHALNYARLGYPQKKIMALVSNVMIASFLFFLSLSTALPSLFFLVINLAYAGYLYKSQDSFFNMHIQKGGEKGSVIGPVIFSAFTTVLLIGLLLGYDYFKAAEFNKAFSMMTEGNYSEAENLFKSYKSYAPKEESTYYNLAIIYQATERHDMAIAELKNLLRLNPRNEDAQSLMAELTGRDTINTQTNNDNMKKGQFTQAFVNALQSAKPTISVVTQGDLELMILWPDGNKSSVSLDNAYARYQLDPKHLDEVIKTYIESFLATNSFSDMVDRSHIVPVIKNVNWLTEIRDQTKQFNTKQNPENVYEKLNEELLIVYAENTPNNIKYLSLKDLDTVGLSRNELRALAVGNLKKLIPSPKIQQVDLISIITAGGDYESSLLLFDNIWDGLSKLNGEIVVAVPACDMILFTERNNMEGINQLRALATKFAGESPYRISDTLFVYRNGHFVRFE